MWHSVGPRSSRQLRRAIGAVTLLVILQASSALAFDELDVPAHKRSRIGLHLLAIDAHAAVTSNPTRILFLDVRTTPEAELLGMPSQVDGNVPFFDYAAPFVWDDERAGLRLERNPHFVEAVDARRIAKSLGKSEPVILICRSGDRSAHAADVLENVGYTRVYTVVDGFEGDVAMDGPLAGKRAVNGWKLSRLPWSYPKSSAPLSLNNSGR